MMSGTARLGLVVACQNSPAGALSRLDAAAAELAELLTEPAVGCCVPALAGGVSLVGGAASKHDVEKAVGAAVERAGREKAVLVLAFLGHAFTTEHNPTMYYMASDTVTTSIRSGVDVGRLLAEAVDELGVAGVIALIDTCHAGGAAPDLDRVKGGTRGGRNRLAVLFASTADQPAFRMQLTTALTGVLRAGVVGSSEYVYPSSELVGRLRDLVAGQVIGRLEHDFDPYAMGSLWLARNRAYNVDSVADVVGPTGRAELRQAVAAWRPEHRFPDRWTREALTELEAVVAGTEAVGEPAWHRVADRVRMIVECVATAGMLQKLLAASMTTARLRAAARLAGMSTSGELSGTMLLRDVLEQATLVLAPVARHRLETVTRFVAALVLESETDHGDPRLRQWAEERDIVTELNDALDVVASARRTTQTRLVVSLADALTDWPEQLEVWLLRDRLALPAQRSVPCELADRTGAERAIGAAMRWARAQLTDGTELTHVDVVAPAHLLACWYPEESAIGAHYLGVHHLVTPRWSGRLSPALEHGDINAAARAILTAMATVAGAPVDWVSTDDLRDLPGLYARLRAGVFRGAIGVDHVPADLHHVLEILLPYSPIVLWPRQDVAADHWPPTLDEHWDTLPSGLLMAYRHRLANGAAGAADDLSCVRGVWHDELWLDFCQWFETRYVAPLEEDP